MNSVSPLILLEDLKREFTRVHGESERCSAMLQYMLPTDPAYPETIRSHGQLANERDFLAHAIAERVCGLD